MFRSLCSQAKLLPKIVVQAQYTKTLQSHTYHSIMTEAAAPKAQALPPLSRQDRDTYARMGETMELFHNSFRNTWNILYGACSSGKRPTNMSIRQFLNTGCDFCHHLHMHHSIGLHSYSSASNGVLKAWGRGAAYLPRSCPPNACISEGA